MSFITNLSLVDRQLQLEAWVSAFHELRANTVVRMAGAAFFGTTKDTNFWTETNAGTGSETQSGGTLAISTGVTANSTAQYQSVRPGVWIPGNENTFRTVLKVNDTGTSQNVRNWGAFNATDGCFFQLNGTTLNIVCRFNSVDTVVPKASWNKSTAFTLDTNYHVWEIRMAYSNKDFYIDGTLVHAIPLASSANTQTLNLPITFQNNNSGGSTTNVTMTAAVAMILRHGQIDTQEIYKHITSATTTVCKQNAGRLHSIVVNNPSNNNITIYDNTSATGNIIAVLAPGNVTTPFTVPYEVPFFTGLTIVTAGAPDLTIIYE